MPNATATGGSTGTDLNGAAVMNACKQIAQHLRPFRLNSILQTKQQISFPKHQISFPNKAIPGKGTPRLPGRRWWGRLTRQGLSLLPLDSTTPLHWTMSMEKHIVSANSWKDANIFSAETNTGSVFNYLTNGVGCSLVELNCLTGAFQLLRSTAKTKFCNNPFIWS